MILNKKKENSMKSLRIWWFLINLKISENFPPPHIFRRCIWDSTLKSQTPPPIISEEITEKTQIYQDLGKSKKIRKTSNNNWNWGVLMKSFCFQTLNLELSNNHLSLEWYHYIAKFTFSNLLTVLAYWAKKTMIYF